MVSFKQKYTASLTQWRSAVDTGHYDGEFERIYGVDEVATWRVNYLEALASFAECYGGEGQLLIARCPAR
jgi:hypothetical protein